MSNKLRRSISFLAISTAVLLSSCQKDEIELTNQESSVLNAKEWFENTKPNLEALKYTETIDWSNAIVLDNDGEQAIEVPLKLIDDASTNVVSDIEYKTFMRLLLIKNIDDTYKVFNIVYTTKDVSFNNSDKSFNILDIGSQFSGYITIQKSDNTIGYSGKYENSEFSGLHNYNPEKRLTDRLVCSYYVTVGNYTTCSNWVWYPDYTFGPGGPGTLPPGYMPGISGPLYPNGLPAFDPCFAAKNATSVAANASFISAKAAIIQAGADGKEHSITLGYPGPAGPYTQSAMRNGGTNDVSVNETLSGAFAAIHNHPNNTPLSAGDIYVAVTLNTKNAAFYTSIIVTGGETYAIVVNNLPAAKEFVKNNPPDLSPNYPPEFPDNIFDQILDIRTKLGESIEARTEAIATVLDANNAGITLMKQDSSGKFNRIKLQKTNNPDGTVSYIAVPC
ncbi:hypothetical protein [Flavobacterium sp. Root420]|uniref:hypothetical protein n=1 Tax=Flavobacterium sp. Root420 TaxID=1736533 RepID=UPI0006FBF45A|nr:hypothetical protein [Flavobacterium sp. Root420]KQW99456.1 hypothetical protein ASC72_10330 [Flavobacterium sp. Root420]